MIFRFCFCFQKENDPGALIQLREIQSVIDNSNSLANRAHQSLYSIQDFILFQVYKIGLIC